ncbi:DUF4129 domain-containing protein [Planomonospora venezuelensis]|uniref:Protein-glutamine gamma-glutamyltransferase-like C-terminal domain-containing protein n=1 Tax=Planomonospora venezuelensis TaxID=1999 RepID=A0A841DDJ8_PLAVE|nr:DUF4129 domain-containing protein [Planomonospora venezuelensis]MBB5966175.1 hypothetical protein [Planomonospora venezuelensis]GIN01952.1 hypothetical protein Pve01_36100 [Planomonospora venezuelensis]
MERRSGWGPLALAVAGLLAAGLAAGWIDRGGGFGLGDTLGFDLTLGRPAPSGTGGPENDPPPSGGDALGEFSFWTVVVAGAAIAAPVIVMLVRMILRARDGTAARPGPVPAPGEPEAADRAGEVREALRAGLAGLDAGDDPRRAVIACWLRLEHTAAGAGTPRAAADTSSDLVARLLAAHRVGPGALDRLASAYRRARYSPREVDGFLREEARRALAEVDAELAS